MVVIHIKRSETDGFLFECSVTDSNDSIIREICAVHALREKLGRLSGMVDELAIHGPSKPESERGLDEVAEREGRVVVKGPHYRSDPLGSRTGDAPAPGLADVLAKTSADGLSAASRDHASRGVALTSRGLQEKVDNIRGAVAMAYPMGLPEWDPVRLMIESKLDGTDFLAEMAGKDILDPATATLWWAGKEFFRDGLVGDRVGKNEKTKVVARLQSATGGAPVREPAVTEEERKSMMAHYFKKQEEEKRLVEDNDDNYVSVKSQAMHTNC